MRSALEVLQVPIREGFLHGVEKLRDLFAENAREIRQERIVTADAAEGDLEVPWLALRAISADERFRDFNQLVKLDRLGDVGVHAGGEAAFAVALHRVSCHSNYGQMLAR